MNISDIESKTGNVAWEKLLSGEKLLVRYLLLKPGSVLPKITDLYPFRAVLMVEEDVTPEWQSQVSAWLVASGCLYMMAWGKNCSTWDDSVDCANLEAFDYNEIPEEKFVMTTWHEDESLYDVYFFSKYNAVHPTVEIGNTLLLHISGENKEEELLSEYANAACR